VSWRRTERAEQAKSNTASPLFEPRIEARQIPELPAVAAWQDVLSRAFLANGELESSYFE
jgi:outer membrane protein, heavy metal efflux system